MAAKRMTNDQLLNDMTNNQLTMNLSSLFYSSLIMVSLLFHSLTVNANNITNHNLLTITEDTLNKKLYDLIYYSSDTNENFFKQVEDLIKKGANPNANLELTKSVYKLGARLFGQYYKSKTKLITYYSSPFHAAVIKKNVPLIQKMIDLGAKSNMASKNGVYPIELAMGNKDEPMIFCLLENGVDIKTISIAYSLEDQVIKKLLKMGANPNIPSKNGDYIINSHIFSDRDSSMAFLLIKHGADVSTIDLSGCFSLELTEKLVKKGANPKTIDINKAGFESKESLKRILAIKPDIKNQKINFSDLFKNSEFLDIMLDYGMSINVKSNIGNYPLIFGAVRYTDIATVNKLVKKGAKLTTLYRSETLLFHAVDFNRPDMVDFLIGKGANVNKIISDESILNQAAENGNDEIINKLIDAGANIEFKSSWYKVSPLMTAVKKGNYTSVKTLIKRGANVNYKTPNGETALIYAIDLIGGFNKYKSAIIKHLIKSGAKTNIKYKGQTLVEFARDNDATTEIIHYLKISEEKPNNINKKQEIKLEKEDAIQVQYLLSIKSDQKISENDFKFIFGDPIILDVLLDSNFNINIIGGYLSWPFIFGAIEYGDTLAVKKILEKGVKLSFRDKSTNLTPLLFAVDKDKYEITKFLLNRGADANDEGYFDKSALVIAIRSENERIVKLLIENGANTNKTYRNKSLLEYAISEDAPNKIIEHLKQVQK